MISSCDIEPQIKYMKDSKCEAGQSQDLICVDVILIWLSVINPMTRFISTHTGHHYSSLSVFFNRQLILEIKKCSIFKHQHYFKESAG